MGERKPESKNSETSHGLGLNSGSHDSELAAPPLANALCHSALPTELSHSALLTEVSHYPIVFYPLSYPAIS